jgi:predicted dienelactone hydrolase
MPPTYRLIFVTFFSCWLLLNGSIAAQATPLRESLVLHDESRGRAIPAELYFPSTASGCRNNHTCPVAFISSGYGQNANAYSFIAKTLNEAGYLVVSVLDELPSDPKLAGEGKFLALRMPI